MVVAVVGLVLGTVELVTAPAAPADVVLATGSAFGASVTPSGLAISVAPQPLVSFPPPLTSGPFTASLANLQAPPTGNPPGSFFSASGLAVSTGPVGVLGTHTGGSHSSTDVASANYLLDVVVATGVHSECTSTGAGSVASTTIGTIAFADAATGAFKTAFNYSPPPNTTFAVFENKETVTFNEQVKLNGPQTTGILVNAIHIRNGAVDVIVGQSRCTATGPDVIVEPPPLHTTLAVAASPSSGPAPLTVTYTYTETNDGANSLLGISLFDSVCSPVVFVSGDTDNDKFLDPGETWNFTCTHTFTAPGTYPNTVVAAGFLPGTGASHLEQAQTTVTVGQPPACDLAITKDMTPSPLVRGLPATITITVTNVGGAPCDGAFLEDRKVTGLTFPTGPVTTQPDWFCGLTTATKDANCLRSLSLPAGYAATFTLRATVAANAPATVTNCATIASPSDTNPANDRSCATADVVTGMQRPHCDLVVTKTMAPDPLITGQPASITISIRNIGTLPCDTTGTAQTVVRDAKVAGLTLSGPLVPGQSGWSPCTLTAGTASCANPTNLPAGYTATFTVNGVVTAAAGTMVKNCATVANPSDLVTTNNSSCVAVQGGRQLGLRPAGHQDRDPLAGGQRQQGGHQDHRDQRGRRQRPGDALHKTVVTDPAVPGLTRAKPTTGATGWACRQSGNDAVCDRTSALAPNASAIFNISATVTAPGPSTLRNCATVTNSADAMTANNTGCVDIVVIAVGSCDLKIVKTMTPASVANGTVVTVSINVINVGTGPCTGPTLLEDPKVAGLTFTATPTANQTGWLCGVDSAGNATCRDVASLPRSYNVTFTIRGTVTGNKGDTFENCAMITNPADGNPANNRSCVTRIIK